MRIAIDVDGVLADWNSAFINLLHSLSGFDLPKGFVPGYWNEIDNLAGEALRVNAWDYINRNPNWWLRIPPYLNNAASLRKWQLRFEMFFVTARPCVGSWTEMWLKQQGIHSPQVISKIKNKANLYSAMDVEYSIDDSLDTVQGCQKISGEHFLLNRPWNITDGLLLSPFLRLPDLESFFSHLDLKEKLNELKKRKKTS